MRMMVRLLFVFVFIASAGSQICDGGCNEANNGGECAEEGEYCTCNPGWWGDNCAYSMCQSSPCTSYLQCIPYVLDEEYGARCACPAHLTISQCTAQLCLSSPCSNGGTCVRNNGDDSVTCECAPPFDGPFCLEQPCESNPCQNGGTCVLGVGLSEPVCLCSWYHFGTFCETAISPTHNCAFDANPCDGFIEACSRTSGKCDCPGNVFGASCQLHNPCDATLCRNGGTCSQVGNTNTESLSFACSCPEFVTGQQCETVMVTPCDSSPCQNGGTCIVDGKVPGNMTFFCECDVNLHVGALCNKPNPCLSQPCTNGGLCLQGGILWDEYTCECPRPSLRSNGPAFGGLNCEEVVPSPCESSPCLNYGYCFTEQFFSGNSNNFTLGFRCECLSNSFGELCESVTPCRSAVCFNEGTCYMDVCHNGGTCDREGTSYRCNCSPYARGSHCEVQSPCIHISCLNGGTCFWAASGTASCTCVVPYGGTDCSVNSVACSASGSMACQNGGQCDNDRCTCLPCFTGTHCEQLISDTPQCTPFVCDSSGGTPCNADPNGIDPLCYCPQHKAGSSTLFVVVLVCVLAVIFIIAGAIACALYRRSRSNTSGTTNKFLLENLVQNEMSDSVDWE